MINEKNLPHATGIYKITNLVNGKVYIGQSKDIYNRYNSKHKYAYKQNKVSHYHLYQAFQKYGLNNFSIEVVELCQKEKLNEREIYWIKYYDSYNNGYNMTPGGTFFSPKVFSKETEEKRKQTREKNQSLKSENHPRAKLTNEEVVAIRQRYKQGEHSFSIYQDYKNIYPHFEVFQRIILGKTYISAGNIPTDEEKKRNSSTRKLNDSQIIEIRKAYYENNESQTSLANKYNLSQSSIKDIINRVTYKYVKDEIEDKRARKTYRLQPEQVKEIRLLAAQGASIQELSSKYHIDSTAIRKCINRVTYKNIE